MIRLSLLDYGTLCKLYIEGDDLEEVKRTHYSLYNWGACRSELQGGDYINGVYQFFIWSNRKKLIKYWYNVLENHYYLRTGHEGEGPLFHKKLMEQAQKKYLSIERRDCTEKKVKILGDFDWRCYSEFVEY